MRDDEELSFSCQRDGLPALPAPLQRGGYEAAAAGGGVTGHPLHDGVFEPQDALPLPPAWGAGSAARRPVAVPPLAGGAHQECFLNERDFTARKLALLDALQVQEADREEHEVWHNEFEEELAREAAGGR